MKVNEYSYVEACEKYVTSYRAKKARPSGAWCLLARRVASPRGAGAQSGRCALRLTSFTACASRVRHTHDTPAEEKGIVDVH